MDGLARSVVAERHADAASHLVSGDECSNQVARCGVRPVGNRESGSNHCRPGMPLPVDVIEVKGVGQSRVLKCVPGGIRTGRVSGTSGDVRRKPFQARSVRGLVTAERASGRVHQAELCFLCHVRRKVLKTRIHEAFGKGLLCGGRYGALSTIHTRQAGLSCCGKSNIARRRQHFRLLDVELLVTAFQQDLPGMLRLETADDGAPSE